MPSVTDSWGIEVGSNAIKAIRLQRRGEEIKVADFDVLPFKKVLTTPDLDADEAIRLGLDQLLNRHNFAKSTVVVSVPGHLAFARFAKLPPVEPKKIPDIVKFEAVQQIPFPIEQVEWDYQTFQDEDSPDVEVGIFAITKDRVLPWLSNFQQVGMPVHAIVLSPVAVFNALNYDLDLHAEPNGTILMDIGTQATDLIITDRGRLWTRTIPMGGNRFTEALVRSFKLSFSKAEKLKREAPSSKYARQIFQAMRPVFVDLVQEVQKSLGYYQSLNRDVELGKLIGMGSTFRLPGLQTFLKQQLQIEVQRLDAFKKIEVEGREAATFAENTLTLAPAYGLAMQGIERETVSCNLLPTAVAHRQVWRAKQPVFAAAAAVMIAAAALAGARTMMAAKQFDSPENQNARKQVADILEQERQITSRWDEIRQQSDLRPEIRRLNRILTYRDVSAGLLLDIDQALAAIQTQPALLPDASGKIDWKAYKAIPRTQRRQIFIEEMSVTYENVSPDNYQPLTSFPRDTQPQAFENFVPSYLVTLIGTTPMKNPSDFLYQTFIPALKREKPSPDRSYFVPVVNLIKVAPIGETNVPEFQIPTVPTYPGTGGYPAGIEGGYGPYGPFGPFGPGGMGEEYMPEMAPPPQPGSRSPLNPPGGTTLPGGIGLPGGTGQPRVFIPGQTPSPTQTTPTQGAETVVSEIPLLPESPLAGEDVSTDSRFVIQWRLVLRDPKQLDRITDPTQPDDDQPAADAQPAGNAE